MAKTVAIIGTLDTKGQEFLFIKETIEKAGLRTLVIDSSSRGKPYFTADVTREEVAAAVGVKMEELVASTDRGFAVSTMMNGITAVLVKLQAEGRIDGVISLGGTAGTTIGTKAMQALPVGVPKLMVSTVASGDTRPYVGTKDVTMMYSIVDIAGLNSISRRILSNAANAIAGMVGYSVPLPEDTKPLIGATMFGVTTPCVTMARERLEQLGYEVLVFHATGAGGQSMEALIEGGFMKGVLDLTTTEWCDELVGGVLNAGPNRLEAAGKLGVPQVVSVGALDMVNFGPVDTVPEKFKDRLLYQHNPTITLMRTTVEECRELGHILAQKLNMAKGPTVLFLPLQSVSLYDVQGHSFYGPEQRKVLYDVLRAEIDPSVVELREMDNAINDEAFAFAAADRLHALITAGK